MLALQWQHQLSSSYRIIQWFYVNSPQQILVDKPVKLRELTHAIDKLLAKSPAPPAASPAEVLPVSRNSKVYLVDDDVQVRGAISAVLEDDGRVVEAYAPARRSWKPFIPKKTPVS